MRGAKISRLTQRRTRGLCAEAFKKARDVRSFFRPRTFAIYCIRHKCLVRPFTLFCCIPPLPE